MQNPVGFAPVGGDHQVGGAAADVDAGQPQAGGRGCSARLKPPGSLQAQKGIYIAFEFLCDLRIEIDKLRTAGLVPFDHQFGFLRNGCGRCFGAKHRPDQMQRALGPAADDGLLLHRRGRGQGQDDAVKPARQFRLRPFGARAGVVHLHQCVADHLGQHEPKQRRPGKARPDRAVFRCLARCAQALANLVFDPRDHIARLVQLAHRRADGFGQVVGVIVPVKAPVLLAHLVVPDIPLGRGQARCRLGPFLGLDQA